MAETSGLWTTDAAPAGHQVVSYTQALVSDMLKITSACKDFQGVAPRYGGQLEPSSTGVNNARIATGSAMVDGKYYSSTANEDHVIANAAAGETRIDRIVLRATWANFECVQTIIAGVSGPAPTAPAITQTTGVTYDIMICQVLVTDGGVITITDEREFASVGILTSIDDDAIDSQHYAAGSIDLEHMAANSVDSDQYVDGSIDLAHLSADCVDDTKVGNRVPALTRRQGGSATIWSTAGSTDYTPTTVRMQTGTIEWVGPAASSGSVEITYPQAFSFTPILIAIALHGTGNINVSVFDTLHSSASSYLLWISSSGTETAVTIFWLAIGPE